jgi:hypothetical protein
VGGFQGRLPHHNMKKSVLHKGMCSGGHTFSKMAEQTFLMKTSETADNAKRIIVLIEDNRHNAAADGNKKLDTSCGKKKYIILDDVRCHNIYASLTSKQVTYNDNQAYTVLWIREAALKWIFRGYETGYIHYHEVARKRQA